MLPNNYSNIRKCLINFLTIFVFILIPELAWHAFCYKGLLKVYSYDRLGPHV